MPEQCRTQRHVSDQSNMSSDNDMDMESNIREEESINEKNYVKVCDWDQLSIKMKENLSVAILLRASYWKNLKMTD